MKKTVLGDTQAFGSHDFLDQLADKVSTVGTHLMDIPLSKIRESENVRRTYEGIEPLAASIRGEGLLQPIQVIPGPGGFFDILVGHRRARAFRILEAGDPAKFGKIPAIVRDAGGLKPRDIIILQLAENLVREGLSPLDLRDGLERLRGMGLTHREIAEKIGRSEGYVAQLFTTVNTIEKNPPLKELLEGDVNITLSDIGEVKSLPAPIQVEVIKEKVSGVLGTQVALRERVKEIRDRLTKKNKRPIPSRPPISIWSEKEGQIRVRGLSFDIGKATLEDLEELKQNLSAFLRRLKQAQVMKLEGHP